MELLNLLFAYSAGEILACCYSQSTISTEILPLGRHLQTQSESDAADAGRAHCFLCLELLVRVIGAPCAGHVVDALHGRNELLLQGRTLTSSSMAWVSLTSRSGPAADRAATMYLPLLSSRDSSGRRGRREGAKGTTRTSRHRARSFRLPHPSAITGSGKFLPGTPHRPSFLPSSLPHHIVSFLPWIRPGSRAPAFLVVTGDPRLSAGLRIRHPSPCRPRIRPLKLQPLEPPR